MIGASLLRARAIEAWRPHAAPQASRALSSQWKQMRDADQYANMAIADGLRSRAAYKLLDIDKRFGRFLRQGAKVVDLGAAPGGFSVVAASRIHLDTEADRWDSPLRDVFAIPVPREPRELRRTIDGAQRRRKFGNLICVDLEDMEPIPGARFVRGDFMDTETQATIRHLLHGSEADVVLSDMSPSTTGDKGLNHDRIMALAEEGAVVAKTLLRNGGVFVCKLFNGEGEREFREFLRSDFLKVKACKPNASRKTSPEIYYVATGYVPKHMQGESARNVVQPSNELLQSVETIVDEYSLLRRPRAASPAVS